MILDDYFVVRKGTNTHKFAAPNGEELWVRLIEKAWAKVNQGYANIVGWQSKDAYYFLTGFSVWIWSPPTSIICNLSKRSSLKV